VRPRQVELARGLDSAVLDLPAPDMKAGLAAPMLAAPAAVPAPPAPVSAVLPVNVTAAAGGLPIGPIVPGTPAGAPGVQPPTLKPPPPQVNPFGDKWRQR
jgi:hypothetical protein